MLASLLRPTLLAWPPGIHALPWVISDFKTLGFGDFVFSLDISRLSILGMRNFGTGRNSPSYSTDYFYGRAPDSRSTPLCGFGISKPSNESCALYLAFIYGILVCCCPREIFLFRFNLLGIYSLFVLTTFIILGLEAPNLFGPRLTISGR